MRLALHGGFAEKGRTSLGIETDGYHLLLDAGVKTSARGGADYWPALRTEELRALDAIVITHAHEDHVAALGWCIEHGFDGRIFMTRETARELDDCLAGYAEASHSARVQAAHIETLPLGADALRVGPLRIGTGRSGHVAGGVWCSIADARTRVVYCSDVAPRSPVFAMDPLPRCDALVIDASYGEDETDATTRAGAIAAWVGRHPGGCVLPTPLYGRSAELLAIVPGLIALAPGMREALRSQIDASAWLVDDVAARLTARLAASVDWRPHDRLPKAALLCHDAMGLSGTSPEILRQVQAHRHPALFTGHLPAHSPGERLVADGAAEWIRLPTHPTLPENLAIVAASGASLVIGHSCDADALARLALRIPALRVELATGDRIDC